MALVDYHHILEPDGVYHIFNHAVGEENLFRNDDNYAYFLKRYAYFINPIAGTYAYCLLPNHFHLAVKFNSREQIFDTYRSIISEEDKQDQKFGSFEGFLSKQFGKLFSSYTQSLNKVSRRKGSLFTQQFKRVKVNSDKQLKNLIHYIHYNPVKHGFVEKPEDWKFNSYHAYLSERQTNIRRDEGLQLFTSKAAFEQIHQGKPDFKLLVPIDY